MSWSNALNTMLPPIRGHKSRINGNGGAILYDWDDRSGSHARGGKPGGIHGGIDCGYGQSINRARPPIFSPIAGKVIATPGRIGRVIIDSGTHHHIFLHLDTIHVKNGASVSRGQFIGRMGNTGTRDYHLHYSIMKPGLAYSLGYSTVKNSIDPVAFWDGKKQILINLPRDANGEFVTDNPESDQIGSEKIANASEPYNNKYTEVENATISGYRPRMAADALASRASVALLPNRMPTHEPWPRYMLVNTRNINAPTDEVDYNTRLKRQLDNDTEEGQKLIGVLYGEVEEERGPFWRR